MKVRSAIAGMGTYAPPLEGRTGEDMLLLDFNESTAPPSAEVVAALVRFLEAGNVQRYPEYGPLTEKLSAYAGVAPGQILLTNGSDQALDVTLRSLLEAGDEMVFARPGFAMIPHFAQTLGAEVVGPDYREDMSFPYEEMLEAVTPRTRVIALIDPNNPTGTAIRGERIEAVLRAFPRVAVLVDEAYYEFTGVTCAPLIARHPNLVITRTFSKAFAMAGMRLGYVLSNPDFVAELHKVRGPYDVNVLAVKAAEAALDHPEGWREYVDEIMAEAKPMVERFFDERGVTYFKGAANFMLVRPDDRDAACEFLKSQRILVRPQGPPIGDTFRVSVGTVADMTRFMEAFARYLDAGPR